MDIEILDGGVGHLLKSSGVVIQGLSYEQQFLAGVLANVHEPIRVQEIHRAYLQSGSTVITTNSFSATPYSLAKIELHHKCHEFIQAAALCARQAVQDSKPTALVAGTLPPLMEWASYQEPCLEEKEMDTLYGQIVKTLDPHVDIFLCETICSLKEALCATRVCESKMSPDHPLWISFTLEDSVHNVLRNGEHFEDTVKQLLQLQKRPDAILVNCCSPMTVSLALRSVAKELISYGILFGGYANGFKTTTTQWLNSTEDSPSSVIREDDYNAEGVILCDAYCQHVKDWRNYRASIFGGCCGTTPDHIKTIATALNHD